MFRAAQFVVRNKFVLIGAMALGFIAFGRNGDESKPVSPWGTDAVQSAARADSESLSEKAFGAVAGAAKQYVGVDISGVAPDKLRKDTLQNWQQTGEAAKRANGN